jgi:hypothetical protein
MFASSGSQLSGDGKFGNLLFGTPSVGILVLAI